MIEFREVTKKYGSKTALNHINLEIERGEIFGIIGHNGAGKSTAIKCLTSIINPTSGEIIVDGQKLSENRLAIKKKIGYVADSPDIFLRLKASEYWDLMAIAYDISKEDYQSRLDKFLNLFNMVEHRDEMIETFSHGMRQKTFLIGALLANPDIWVLDEPMTGLDPQASYDLKEMMKAHAAEGNIVLFSTHVLEVAEELCDRIGILRQGNIISVGTIEELRQQYPDQSLETIYLKMAGREAENTEEESVEADRTGVDSHE